MTQCMNAVELHMDDTIPHTDGLELKRGLTRFFLKKGVSPHPKYHEKLVVDLDALQMSVLQDAFTKARKESGLRDMASLLIHIAKAFLEGCPTSGKRRKPRYQIVIHRHLPSGLAWCDTLKGERPVSPEVLEKVLCDAEIVQLDEPESPTCDRTGGPTGDQTDSPTGDRTDSPTGDRTDSPTGNRTDSPTGNRTDSPTGDRTDSPTGDRTDSPTGNPTWDQTGLPKVSPTGDQSIEKGHNTGKMGTDSNINI